MKSFSFLFWAYNVIWGGIAAYLVLLHLRLRRVGQRLERLEGSLPRDE
jgi:CcmD family protein